MSWNEFRSFEWNTVLLLTAFGLVLLLTGFYQQYSNDLWKALYSGRYLSLFHQFPHHSTFTFSPVEDFQLRNGYNWLGNLVLLGLHRTGGIPGLLLFRLGILLFAVGITYSLIDEVHPLVIFVLVAYAFGIKQKLLLRTAIFVIPCLSFLLWLWIQYDLTGRVSFLWGIPPRMIFWGNVHGSYLVGVGLLGLLVLGQTIDDFVRGDTFRRSKTARLGFVLILVVLGVTFVKPFPDYSVVDRFRNLIVRIADRTDETAIMDGADESPRRTGSNAQRSGEPSNVPGEVHRTDENSSLFRTVKQSVQGIFFEEQSWRPGEFGFPLESYSFLFVSVVLVLFPATLALFVVRPRSFRLVQFLPVAGSLVLAMGYLRTVAFFPLVAVPIGFWKVRKGDFVGYSPGSVSGWAARFGVLLLTLNMFFYAYRGQLGRFFGVAEHRFHVGRTVRFSDSVPDYVLNHYSDETIFTAYNLSSYLIWRWWPRKKVFIDTKGTAYEDEFFGDYGRYPPGELAERHDLSWILVPLGNPRVIQNMIPDGKWALRSFDGGMVLFERVTQPEYRDPMIALRLSPESVRSLPDHVRPGFRSLVAYFYRKQNVDSEFE